MKEGIILGIDAGGSKTLALAASLDGQILGRAQTGPANYQAVGKEAAIHSMNEAVQRALQSARVEARQVLALCIGAAGADRKDGRDFWEGWARQVFPGALYEITHDAMLVLAAGLPEGWGLAVISGTGSIAYARDEHGHLARAGGWGYLMGDEGSNYANGLSVLHAVTRAVDGRGPATALVKEVLDHWRLPEPSALVGKVYGSLPREEIASLGKVVEVTAEAGDRVAAAILDQAGRDLALAAAAAAAQLGFEGAIPCALAGSVLVIGKGVRPAFLRAASEMNLKLEPVGLVAEPAQGAIKLALDVLEKHLK